VVTWAHEHIHSPNQQPTIGDKELVVDKGKSNNHSPNSKTEVYLSKERRREGGVIVL
jgi:hypothetical protein